MANKTPHTTSIAVWDVPSPVVMNRAFTVKVGLTCSAACALTGQPIVVRDGNGIKVGEGKVGETLSPGTSALYGADVDLVAPGEAGMWSWSVVFAGTQGPMPHEDAFASFGFQTARPPQHRVTVKVLDRDTQAPIDSVRARVGAYRASTDARGQATLDVATGTYELSLRKVGYEPHSRIVTVTESVTIRAAAVCALDTNLEDEEVWM